MNSYLAFGKDSKALERIVLENEIRIGYRGKHVPVYELQTELGIDELRELLPEYSIHQQKTYEACDDQ